MRRTKPGEKAFPGLTAPLLAILVAFFLVVSGNYAFYRSLLAVYPLAWRSAPFLASVSFVLFCLTALFLLAFGWRRTLKPLLILVLLVSSVTSYFMNTYNVVIDVQMLRNVLQTDPAETMDLLSPRMAGYFLFLGLLPAAWVTRARVRLRPWNIEARSRLKYAAALLLALPAVAIAFSGNYYSFLREHKLVRSYANPAAWIFSTGRLAFGSAKAKAVRPVGEDAAIPATDTDRELIILVVGEAVRADKLSLNGYAKETNPLLAREDVVSFTSFYSCGTTTSFSVPCMFSVFGRKDYSEGKARETENLLDVLRHAGVNVLWRDNNSNSKGVAERVTYEDYKSPGKNPLCDTECRDEGMLGGLQDYIDRTEAGDIFIVLHQMGNHGPAYYKRYPGRFERFAPVCRSNQLEQCTGEEIENAYANAVLYTDYFLSRVIGLLKANSKDFHTAMVYVSDHGESLGENRVYLHGLPYFVAPDEQKHVAAVMWFGDSFGVDRKALRAISGLRFSHDNLFHTVLGMMEIRTAVYKKDLDILNFDRSLAGVRR